MSLQEHPEAGEDPIEDPDLDGEAWDPAAEPMNLDAKFDEAKDIEALCGSLFSDHEFI